MRQLLLLLSFTFFVLFNGCAPAVLQSNTSRYEVLETEKTNKLEVEVVYSEQLTDSKRFIHLVDSITVQAEHAALNAEFGEAQSLLNFVKELVDQKENETYKDTLLNSYETVNRIARFYVELMPPSYLDSVPGTFSPYVARHQFYAAMSSIDSNTIDTSLIPIECSESSHYNMPIHYDARVQKALVVLLSSERKKRVETLLTRAAHYRPFMNEIYTKAGLPTDLTFLPIIESAFNPKAYSFAHASGLWQFIPSTGKIFGLRENYWVDERRDPIKSTEASVKYFTRLYRMFDDWHLALAAYNCGEGRVSRTIRKTEGSQTYWDLMLPKETMNYVPLFIAHQMIAKNPHCFGFDVRDTTAFPYDTVQISDCVDMGKIATAISIDIKTFRGMNPHIKRWCTPPETKDVTLYIPAGTKETYVAFYKTLKPEDKVKWHRYKVQNGDNLIKIANKFDVKVEAIKSINQMKTSRIIAGRYIFVPVSPGLDAKELKTVATAAKKERSAVKTTPQGSYIQYKLKKGESLYTVSRLFSVSTQELKTWNNITNPKTLQVGALLKVYGQNKISSGKEPLVQEPIVALELTAPENHYTVLSGDNLYNIANNLNVSIADLANWNNKNIQNPVIFPGDKLVYFGTPYKKKDAADTNKTLSPIKKTKYRVRKGDTVYGISRLFGVSPQEVLSANNLTDPTLIHPGDVIVIPDSAKIEQTKRENKLVTYKVRKGDNLWTIANSFNVSVREICLASNISQQKSLFPGDTLQIPLTLK